MKPSHDLFGEIARRQLVPADADPDEVRERRRSPTRDTSVTSTSTVPASRSSRSSTRCAEREADVQRAEHGDRGVGGGHLPEARGATRAPPPRAPSPPRRGRCAGNSAAASGMTRHGDDAEHLVGLAVLLARRARRTRRPRARRDDSDAAPPSPSAPPKTTAASTTTPSTTAVSDADAEVAERGLGQCGRHVSCLRTAASRCLVVDDARAAGRRARSRATAPAVTHSSA